MSLKLPKIYAVCNKCKHKLEVNKMNAMKPIGNCPKCNHDVWNISW